MKTTAKPTPTKSTNSGVTTGRPPKERDAETEAIIDDADALLDEIDGLLEDQEVLVNYRQKNGE